MRQASAGVLYTSRQTRDLRLSGPRSPSPPCPSALDAGCVGACSRNFSVSFCPVHEASLRRTPSTLPPILADGAAPASSSLVCSANFFSTSSAFLFALAFAWACRARRISAPTVAQRSSPSLWPWLSTPPGARFGRPSHAYTACHWTSRLRTLIVTLESSSSFHAVCVCVSV